jgi:hypothetical protein
MIPGWKDITRTKLENLPVKLSEVQGAVFSQQAPEALEANTQNT